MVVLLIIPPAPSIAHTCRQSIDRETFVEEELLENPLLLRHPGQEVERGQEAGNQ